MSVKDLFKGGFRIPERQRSLKIVITTRCSLRCPYCVNNMGQPRVQELGTLLDEVGPEEFLALIDAITIWPSEGGDPITVGLTGAGEPTESPHFVALARGLFARGADLQFGTNLHGVRNIETFADGLDLTGRVVASASFHLGAYTDEQRERYPDLYARAVATGLTMGHVCTPMSPVLLKDGRYLADVERLRAIHPATFVPIELYHTIDGKPYPASYTDEERVALREIQNAVGYDPMTQGTGNVGEGGGSIPSAAIEHLVNYLEVPGQPCLISMFAATIQRTGFIQRCRHTPQTYIGHLRHDPPAELFPTGAKPCPGQRTGCKGVCNQFSLVPHGIGLDDYFREWYADRGRADIAALFGSREGA